MVELKVQILSTFISIYFHSSSFYRPNFLLFGPKSYLENATVVVLLFLASRILSHTCASLLRSVASLAPQGLLFHKTPGGDAVSGGAEPRRGAGVSAANGSWRSQGLRSFASLRAKLEYLRRRMPEGPGAKPRALRRSAPSFARRKAPLFEQFARKCGAKPRCERSELDEDDERTLDEPSEAR